MKRFSILTAVLALGAGSATAATTGFNLELSGKANAPHMTLTNTSTSATLDWFSFTIGDTTYNYDAVYDIVGPAGGAVNIDTGDQRTRGSGRFDQIDLSFTGFDAGESAIWRVDVDLDDVDSKEQFWSVLFNNGSALNAVFTAGFSDQSVLSVTAPDAQPGPDTYTFAANANARIGAVPLPAGLPMLAGALGIFGLMRRRARSKTQD